MYKLYISYRYLSNKPPLPPPQASEDNPLPLQIYNWKDRSFREIILTPSRKWPGEGMLGVTIKFDSYRDAEEQILHVLEVETNSPAEIAGLQPFKDYILGTAERAFLDADSLSQELLSNLDKPVEFYVYNSDTDEVRMVVIMPTEDWGGEGVLGANVAFGFLHVLPSHCCRTIGRSSETDAHKDVNSPFGSNMLNTDKPVEGAASDVDRSSSSSIDPSSSSSSSEAPPTSTSIETSSSGRK